MDVRRRTIEVMFATLRRLVLLGGTSVLAVSAWAQTNSAISEEAYLTPPAPIRDLILAPWSENVSLTNLSPDRRYYLITKSAGGTTLAELSRPYVRLAGIALDPTAMRARSLNMGGAVGFELLDVKTSQTRAIQTPSGAKVSSPRWSPDGKWLAYVASFENESHAYVADVSSGQSRRVTRRPMLATQVTSAEWTGDGQHLILVEVPETGSGAPKPSPVPTEPLVRLTAAGATRLRTFPSLLTNPYEMALLEYMLTGQLVAIPAAGGNPVPIGQPKMIRSLDVGPNAKFVRVTTMQKPFSYLVPASSFGFVEEIWNDKGEAVAELAKRELNLSATPPDPDGLAAPYLDDHDDVDAWDEQGRGAGGRPGGGAGAGAGQAQQSEPRKRSITWRPDGRGLSFLLMEAPRRSEPDFKPKDRVMRWFEPYGENDVEVVYATETPITSVQYSSNPSVLFLGESATGQSIVYAVDLGVPGSKHIISRNRTADFYQTPGTLMTAPGPWGVNTVMLSSDGSKVYLSGTQYYQDPQANAPRPFVDVVTWRTGTAENEASKERLFQSSDVRFERVTAALDPDFASYVISRESRYMPPNFIVVSGDEQVQVTNNRDYNPEATALQRERLRVTRADGIQFWVNVTLPKGWDGSSKPPALFWFYPREYPNQRAYDESGRTYNKNTFRPISRLNKDLLALMGYAVIEPDCPIIGPTERKNDSYVPDLRANLYAAINAVVQRSYADRDRLALGGHSYGAFGTANAMIHTPFFKAGIAGDGNFNRLLTPSGFQSEQRILWEAREVYTTMSPMLWAEQLNGALLMYHGQDDQNVGTALINSERMFHALNVLGKTASLYVYPYEDHGPAANETIMDLWARWVAWLDEYVKNAPATPARG